jgi:nicotinamidase-related amidase
MSHTVDPRDAALVLIDVQPFFVELAAVPDAIVTRIEHLLLLAQSFEMPVVATFEHPVERNGWLPERLERVFPAPAAGVPGAPAARFVKRHFNLYAEPEIRAAVTALGRGQMIVAGAETDVCVLQSVLGLLGAGLAVFLVEDCLFTHETNTGPALRRMQQAGAVPTTYKTLYYELTRSVDSPRLHHAWNERLPGPRPFVGPYDLERLRSAE